MQARSRQPKSKVQIPHSKPSTQAAGSTSTAKNHKTNFSHIIQAHSRQSKSKIQNPNHQLRLPQDQPLQLEHTTQIFHTSTTGPAGIVGCTQNWPFQGSYICAAEFDVRAASFPTFEDTFCIVPRSWRGIHAKEKGGGRKQIIPCLIALSYFVLTGHFIESKPTRKFHGHCLISS